MSDKTFYYDERYYLKPWIHSDCFDDIVKRSNYYANICDNNYVLYRDMIGGYYKYINLVSKLIKEIGIDNNSISYSFILNKLLESGYLSLNGKINIVNGNDKFKEITGFYGINILSGDMCCRHAAYFYQDVFDKLGMFSELLPCLYGNGISRTEALSRRADHIINLLEYNKVLCGYDLINNLFFKFDNEFLLSSLFSSREFYLYYKGYMDMIINGLDYDLIIEKIFKFRENSNLDVVSLDEYKEIISESENIFLKSISLINDFKSDSKKYVKRITKDLNKVEM